MIVTKGESMIPLWLFLACTAKEDSNTIPQSNQDVNDPVDTQDTDQEDTNITPVDTAQVDTAQVDTGSSDTGEDTNPDTDTSDVVMVKDFSLPDINPLSGSVNQTYSPRDYLQKVSGWYFIKGT